jgi:hypothetical protein
MPDCRVIDALESLSLSESAFSHRAHVQAAWECLEASPFGAAGDRFCAAVRRFAASLGKADRYHETITWAYLVLINERRAARPAASFAEFAAANADLLDHKTGPVSRLYSSDVLKADLARRVFVLPRIHV